MEGSGRYFLKTKRLGFSQWHDSDVDLAVMLWGDPTVSSMIGGPFTPDEASVRLRREIEKMVSYKVQYWPVFSLRDGELVGCAGLRPYGSGEDLLEMGVHLRPEYWGLGLA